MDFSRRRFLAGSAALSAPLALAACGGFAPAGSQPSQSAGTLTFTTWGTDAELAGLRSVIERFEAANAGTTVNLNAVPYEQMFSNIDAQIQAGNAPDVFRVPYYTFGSYAGAGQLLDLTSHLPAGFADRFTPQAWAAVQNGGKPFGVPHHTDTSVILYNKTLLDAAGVAAVPTKVGQAWTWPQLLEVAGRLRSSLPASKFPMAYNWQGNGVTRWLSLLFQANGRFLGEDLKTPAIDSEAGRAALDFSKRFFTDKLVPANDSVKSTTYAADTWYSQTAAMVWGGAFMVPDADKTADFEWGATYAPRNVRAGSDFGGNALVATAKTAQPDLAAKFLDFVTEAESMRGFCTTASLLPTRADLVENGITFAKRPELTPVFLGQAAQVRASDSSQVASPVMSKIITVLKDQLEQAFVGGQSTADTMSGLSKGTAPPRAPSEPVRDPAGGPVRASAVSSRQIRGEARAAYVLLTPTLVLLGLFVFVPLVGAAVLSFQRTNGFGAGTFAGLDNYARLLRDGLFWRSLINTTAFTLLVTPLSMALGLGAAVLLNSVLPARGVFRSVLIVPMAISGVATALLGVLIFDENSGVLDKLLQTAGLPGVHWQSGSGAAFSSVVLVTLWWRVGFNMLIYLAGLQGIGPELYEAAVLDGAGRWQQFRRLTVPLLGASTFFLLILNVIYSFQVFDIVFVLTGGGPRNATSVLVTYAYDTGFDVRDQGYAAAIGMVLLVLTMAFTLVQWRTSRGRDEVGGVTREQRGLYAVRLVAAVVVSAIVVFPLYWMVVVALSSRSDLLGSAFRLWPRRLTLENFTRVLSAFPVTTWFGNSVAIALTTAIITVVVNLLGGYAFAQLRFRGSNALFLTALATLTLPVQVIMVALFRLVTALGLYGSYWAVILPTAASAFGLFLARQFILAIPRDLIEAAKIDGAGHVRVFTRIVLPMSKPLVAVLFFMSLLSTWNDFAWPLVALQDNRLFTLPIGLLYLQGQFGPDYGATMAFALINVTPMVVLFLAFQRYFVQGFARSGIR